ncbi:dehydrogenase [Gluconacetobacter sacchari DSM 12717]|uniref:Dehydrogenase n=1 Tax=Gluconacetobacter sacchari DSM 12717 TaxID=1307940 RepID=A0ABQ0P453_9PROT|nr:dehydrogenase [Gluconacetobacter sacchari DSM 12717]
MTGAASGIGLATALRFLEEGASVILVDRDEAALHAVMHGLDPQRAIPSLTDISIPAQVESLLALARRQFGALDVLVNNAGVTTMGTVLECDLAAWNTVCATILNGTIDVSRTFLPMLIDRGGNIVNVASVSGMRGDWNTAYYDVAKGGVVNLTRVMAMDHGRAGVRVNAICPAVTRTGMTKDAVKDKAFVRSVEDRIPLGRLGEPEDMAAAITFLASADAAFVTGLIMPVDGGVTASNGQPPFPMD